MVTSSVSSSLINFVAVLREGVVAVTGSDDLLIFSATFSAVFSVVVSALGATFVFFLFAAFLGAFVLPAPCAFFVTMLDNFLRSPRDHLGAGSLADGESGLTVHNEGYPT